MNKKLSMKDYIVSVIGERPLKLNYQDSNLMKYYYRYFDDDIGNEENFIKILKSKLYIPAIITEAKPSYDQIKVDLLAVLVDCFTDEIAHLIVGEVQFYELCGCLEEREVLTCYYTKDTSALQQAINRLLEKVETAVLWSESL